MVDFVRLEPVLTIIQAAIWTGRISKENPISICLVADQESAKTQSLLYFKNTSTLKYFSDVTSKPLGSFKGDIETKRLRHIVLLDLVRILTHGRGVGERTTQYLAGLMEEGQAITADAGGIQDWAGMPKVGVLMALTPDYYLSNRGKWRKTGFLTRFVRVWFDYSNDTQHVIHKAIQNGFALPDARTEALPPDGQIIEIKAPQAEAIASMASTFSEIELVYGFRYHKQMRALAKALALIEGVHEVTDSHVRKLLSWQRFFTATTPVTL